LVEGVHLALEVMLLEHQSLAVYLRLSVLGIKASKLQEKNRQSPRDPTETQ